MPFISVRCFAFFSVCQCRSFSLIPRLQVQPLPSALIRSPSFRAMIQSAAAFSWTCGKRHREHVDDHKRKQNPRKDHVHRRIDAQEPAITTIAREMRQKSPTAARQTSVSAYLAPGFSPDHIDDRRQRHHQSQKGRNLQGTSSCTVSSVSPAFHRIASGTLII